MIAYLAQFHPNGSKLRLVAEGMPPASHDNVGSFPDIPLPGRIYAPLSSMEAYSVARSTESPAITNMPSIVAKTKILFTPANTSGRQDTSAASQRT
jgi:hypothetical protein